MISVSGTTNASVLASVFTSSPCTCFRPHKGHAPSVEAAFRKGDLSAVRDGGGEAAFPWQGRRAAGAAESPRSERSEVSDRLWVRRLAHSGVTVSRGGSQGVLERRIRVIAPRFVSVTGGSLGLECGRVAEPALSSDS